jgi:glycosyltransferase involved in cell wall biosynthesis
VKTSLESTFDYSTSLQAQSITKVSQKSKKCLIVICAYNEEKSLPSLLQALKGKDVLIVDDGSSDNTRSIAVSSGASILNHEIRLGKAAALADAISYALQNLYEWIIEVGADAIPGSDAIAKIESALENESVGAVSGKQVPIGQSAVAYRVDELMWAILAQDKACGKRQRLSQ